MTHFAKNVFIELVLHPVALFVFLSTPLLLNAAVDGDYKPLFDPAYISVTVKISLILTGIIYLVRLTSSITLRIAAFALVQVMLFIRIFEIVHEHDFGFKFSPLTFFHLDWTAVLIALQQKWVNFIIFILITLIALFVVIRYMKTIKGINTTTRPVTFLVVALMSYSAYAIQNDNPTMLKQYSSEYSFIEQAFSFYSYKNTYKNLTWTPSDEETFSRLGISINSPVISDTNKYGTPYNLVILYLESFQANFTGPGKSKFKDLTPHLDRFAFDNTYIDNYYNAVMPTLNALVSSQCGVLVELDNEHIKGGLEFYNHLFCLSDALHTKGFYQVYMQGSPLEFAGTNSFVTTHNFDEILGWNELSPNSDKYKSHRNEWGLHDTDLLREVTHKLHELKDKSPFHVTAMTINTHYPGLVDPDCPQYMPDNSALNAIHCTDAAVGEFLSELDRLGMMDNTVILIVGDHMSFPVKANLKLLGSDVVSSYFGKTFMAIHTPQHILPSVVSSAAYTPDIAPTMLELLGYQTDNFFFGKSLLNSRKNYQHLIAPRFQVINGQAMIDDATSRFGAVCPEHDKLMQPLSFKESAYSDCERSRVVLLFNQKLFGDQGLIYSARQMKIKQ